MIANPRSWHIFPKIEDSVEAGQLNRLEDFCSWHRGLTTILSKEIRQWHNGCSFKFHRLIYISMNTRNEAEDTEGWTTAYMWTCE